TTFRPRSEHPVGLLGSLGDQIVNQYPDICLVPFKDQGVFFIDFQVGVYPGHKALGSGLLVARGPVDLSRKIEVVYQFCLQGMLELCRWEIVVFYGISRPEKQIGRASCSEKV